MTAKIIFNPPPGWTVPERGWVPSVSWQPPEEWPPVPAGWPLFYVRRTAVTSVVWLAGVLAAAQAYTWFCAKTGHPLPQEAFGLVGICILAFIIAGRMSVLKAAPLTKWPWLPNRAPDNSSPVREHG